MVAERHSRAVTIQAYTPHDVALHDTAHEQLGVFAMSRSREQTHSRRKPDASAPKRPQTSPARKIVNFRLLLFTAIAVVIAVPTLFIWQRYQADRNAVALLERADVLAKQAEARNKEAEELKARQKIEEARKKEEEAKDLWRDAAKRIEHYLTVNPDDVDARLKMVDAFHKSARSIRTLVRASELYGVALGLAPDDRPTRQRYAELLLDLGRYPNALEQANYLLKADHADPVGLKVRALATIATVERDTIAERTDIAKMFRSAVDANPNDIDLSVRTAAIYRMQAEKTSNSLLATMADATIDKMVEKNRTSEMAYLHRYYYRTTVGSRSADADLDRALELGPRNVTVLLAAGRRALEKQDYERASTYFNKVIEEDEFDSRGYAWAGAVHAAAGDSDRAIKAWQKGIDKVEPERKLRLVILVAERQIGSNRLKEAGETLKLAQALADERIPRMQPELRGKLRSSMAFLWSRWHLAKQQYSQAIPHLKQLLLSERLFVEEDKRVDELADAHAQLARCYASMDLWDVAASEFDKAAQLRPAVAAYVAGAAIAWERAGALHRAIPLLETAAEFEDAPDDVWTASVRAHTRLQAIAPPANRDWTTVDRLLIQAKEKLPDSLELSLLDCQVDLLKDNVPAAVEKLESLHKQSPDDWPSTRALILTYTSDSRKEDAKRILDEAAKDGSNALDVLLLRSQLLVGDQEFDQACELLKSALPTFTGREKNIVASRLADLYIETAKIEEAQRMLDVVLAEDPSNMAALRRQCDVAMQISQYDVAAEYERRLAKIEGRDGTWWRYLRARRLALQAEHPTDSRLGQAMNLQTEIQSARPSWPQAYELKGLIANRRDNLGEALDAYRTAIDLGDRRVSVFRSVITLLYRENRFAEAARYLERLQQMGTNTQDLGAMAVALSVRQGEMERAVELANDAVRERPDDPAAHSWLGSVLAASGKNDLAGVEFRLAVEMAPDDIRAWTALLSFYAMTGQTESARQLIEDIDSNPNLPEPKKVFVLAQGYELVDDLAAAEAHYRKAIELAEDDAAVWYRTAQFFENRDEAMAEKCLRKAHDVAPDSDDVTSALAGFLARRGGEKNLKEAWELVGLNGSDDGSTLNKSKVTASLLMRGGEDDSRRQAQRMLEEMVETNVNADPDVYVFLARIYESEGLLQRARQQLLQLVNRPDRTADHLGAYVNMLLRHGMSSAAGEWLKQLEQAEPDSLRTFTLKTRWLAAENRTDEVKPLLAEYAQKHVENNEDRESAVKEMLRVAQLYSGVAMHNEAEDWFRRAVDAEPRTYWALVGWLAGQDRLDEAIKICLETAKTDVTPGAAIVLSTVMTKPGFPEKFGPPCEAVISDAIAKHPRDISLLFSIGTLRYLQNRNNEAIDLYRKVIQWDPDHVMTLNNLASLLMEKPDYRDEALKHIERAISLAGPTVALQDTKGMVLLAQGQVDEAVDVFRATTMEPPVDPRFHFHLALAYHKAGEDEDARQSLTKAVDGGVHETTLSQYETRELTLLEQQLLQ